MLFTDLVMICLLFFSRFVVYLVVFFLDRHDLGSDPGEINGSNLNDYFTYEIILANNKIIVFESETLLIFELE